MKRTLTLMNLLLCIFISRSQSLNFSVTNLTGTYTLTCANPTINLLASSNFSFAVSYSWASSNTTLTGNSVGLTVPGSYTVTAFSGTLFSNQLVSISINTAVPSGTISPLSQSISCGTSPVVTATASLVNSLSQLISTPFGGTFTSNSSTLTYSPIGPGSYTYMVVDNTNGCTSAPIVFNITGGLAFPTFSVVSPQNFTLGCGTKSVATINIVNGATSPPGGPVSYSILGSNSAFTVNTGGNYTVVVKDNTNLCTTMIPITVTQNTTAPNINAIVPQQILDCYTPVVQLQGFSSLANTSFTWSFPGVVGSVPGNIITVMANTVIATSSIIANYTLTVMDNSSTCKSFSVIPMFQNVFPPLAKITQNGSEPCITPTVVLTNSSNTGIPVSVFSNTLPVVAVAWLGPVPQVSAALSSTYLAYTAGVYTLSVQDLNNGCKSSVTTANCTGLATESSQQNTIHIYPNPGNGIYTIYFDKTNNNHELQVFNLLGELIHSETLSSHKNEIDLQHLQKGIYLFLILREGELLGVKRIVKN